MKKPKKDNLKLTNWQVFIICIVTISIIGFLEWTALQKNIDGIALASVIAALVGIIAAVIGVKIRDILFSK